MNTWLGFAWILLAGLMQGLFPLPMKYTRRWKWEHLWLVYSAAAFFVLPLVVAWFTVPRLAEVLRQSSPAQLALTALFGVAWGAGSVFFGLGLDALGMALGFSLMTALLTALGAIIPLAVLTPELILQRNGLMTLAGNAVTIAGVILCAMAGHERDRAMPGSAVQPVLSVKRSFPVALTLCIAAGVLSAMFNFGYAFGSQTIRLAVSLGATPDGAVNAIWLVELPAGGIVNVLYCLHLLRKNDSWDRFRGSALVEWINAVVMAILWTGSVVVYGWGANALGHLGPTLGWSLWNAILIAATFTCGLLTHEWDGVRGRPIRLLTAGIAVLIAGMFVLGAGV